MIKIDELALITFIACDIFIENTNEIKFIYRKINCETKEIIKMLFR